MWYHIGMADTEKDYTIEELLELKTSGKFTLEVLSKLEEGFKRDFTNEEAARYAGITPATYYNYYNMSSEFREKMDRAKDFLFYAAKNNWANAILGVKDKEGKYITKPDPELSVKFLERRQKHLYSLRTELTGEDGKPVDNDKEDLKSIANSLKRMAHATDGSNEAESETNS